MWYGNVLVGRVAGHTYGKLNPWAVGSSELASESESNLETTEKRSSCDFALWKVCFLNLFSLKCSEL
jgi:cysteinyl-tRNA synthetase